MWFMLNIFISSIEIELIELFNLQTKRWEVCGFKNDLEMKNWIKAQYLMVSADWCFRSRKDQPLILAQLVLLFCINVTEDTTQAPWTSGYLMRSWLFHPQAWMPVYRAVTICCLEAPLLSTSYQVTCSCQSTYVFLSGKKERLGSLKELACHEHPVILPQLNASDLFNLAKVFLWHTSLAHWHSPDESWMFHMLLLCVLMKLLEIAHLDKKNYLLEKCETYNKDFS